MHVDRDNGNQRRDLCRMLQNMLSHGPWLDEGVVSSKQQRTFQSIAFTETCNAHQFIDVFSRIRVARYGKKYAKLCLGHCCRSWLAFAEISNSVGYIEWGSFNL